MSCSRFELYICSKRNSNSNTETALMKTNGSTWKPKHVHEMEVQKRSHGKIVCSQKEHVKLNVGKSPNSSVANIRSVWTGQ